MILPNLQGTRGTVLVVAMLLMTALAIIGIAANTNVVTDTGIASNYLSSLQSFYAAEAGLERGKTECAERFARAGWSNFNPILRGSDDTPGTADDGILSFGSRVSYHNGSYSVRVVNEAGDGGGADSNGAITIISRGSHGNSVTTLTSTIAMNYIPDLPAAVNMVGKASTFFVNDSFLVDGRDYLLSDTERPNGPSAPHLGIAISDIPSPGLAREQVVRSLVSNQLDNVLGSVSSPSIDVSSTLNKRFLKQYVDALKRVADSRIANPDDVLSTSGPDNSVVVGGQSFGLGTPSAPKIAHLSKPGGGTISLSGSGFGVLIVEGNNISFKPNINFIGVIILLGNNVVLDDTGLSMGLQLKGGLVVGELSAPGTGYDLVVSGNSRILYSREAIDQIREFLMKNKRYTVLSWQRSY